LGAAELEGVFIPALSDGKGDKAKAFVAKSLHPQERAEESSW
jgi:hypothetical protein